MCYRGAGLVHAVSAGPSDMHVEVSQLSCNGTTPGGGVDSVCLVRMASPCCSDNKSSVTPRHIPAMASQGDNALSQSFNSLAQLIEIMHQRRPNNPTLGNHTLQLPPPQVSVQFPSMTQAEPVSRHVLGQLIPSRFSPTNAPRMLPPSFPAAWPGQEPSHSSSLAPTSLSRTHTAPTLHIPSTYLCPHPPSSFPIPRACQHLITSTTSYITARVCHYTQDPSTVYTHLCVSILWDTSRPRSLDSSKPSPSSSAASRSSSISRPSPLASRI